MSIQVNLKDIQHARDSKDPQLPRLIDRLSRQQDQQSATARKDPPTFDAFLSVINSEVFRRQSREEKALYRMAQIRLLESDQDDTPLPDRLRLHEIILTLWQDDSPFARSCLFEVIAGVNLTYGPWRALKRIYKEAETKGDTQIMGALAARFDMAFSNQNHQVSHKTLTFHVTDTTAVKGIRFTTTTPATSITVTLNIGGTPATASQLFLGGTPTQASSGSPLTFTR